MYIYIKNEKKLLVDIKLIYRFHVIPIKIPIKFFMKLDKLILKLL